MYFPLTVLLSVWSSRIIIMIVHHNKVQIAYIAVTKTKKNPDLNVHTQFYSAT